MVNAGAACIVRGDAAVGYGWAVRVDGEDWPTLHPCRRMTIQRTREGRGRPRPRPPPGPQPAAPADPRKRRRISPPGEEAYLRPWRNGHRRPDPRKAAWVTILRHRPGRARSWSSMRTRMSRRRSPRSMTTKTVTTTMMMMPRSFPEAERDVGIVRHRHHRRGRDPSDRNVGTNAGGSRRRRPFL